MMDCQKQLFSLSDEFAYLNCAYMSPQLRSVEAVGKEFLARKNEPYLIHPEDFFTEVRTVKELFARMINSSEPERIALVPSVSYGIANATRNIKLKASQHVIVAAEQFPSNYYSWQRLTETSGASLRVVGPPSAEDRTLQWNRALLEAIDEGTAVVALSHTHWADGTLFDLQAIRERTEAVGALMIIDGTQSVGALPFDVQTLRPDALICAGYKWLMGPYSTGVAYYGPYFDSGLPIEENWINRRESEDFQHLVNYQSDYQPGAGRYAVGEQSNFILTPMLRAALQQLLDWGVPAIQEYCRGLSRQPLEQLREMGVIVEKEAHRSGHLIGLRLGDKFDIERLKTILQRERVFVSLRGSAIRVAPNVYNDAHDFERLTACFAQARRKAVY